VASCHQDIKIDRRRCRIRRPSSGQVTHVALL